MAWIMAIVRQTLLLTKAYFVIVGEFSLIYSKSMWGSCFFWKLFAFIYSLLPHLFWFFWKGMKRQNKGKTFIVATLVFIKWGLLLAFARNCFATNSANIIAICSIAPLLLNESPFHLASAYITGVRLLTLNYFLTVNY